MHSSQSSTPIVPIPWRHPSAVVVVLPSNYQVHTGSLGVVSEPLLCVTTPDGRPCPPGGLAGRTLGWAGPALAKPTVPHPNLRGAPATEGRLLLLAYSTRHNAFQCFGVVTFFTASLHNTFPILLGQSTPCQAPTQLLAHLHPPA